MVNNARILTFILILFVQISPVFIVPAVMKDAVIEKKLFEDEFNECVDEFAKALIGYKRELYTYQPEKIPTLKEARSMLDKFEIEYCGKLAKERGGKVSIGILFVLIIFICVPFSWLLSWVCFLTYSILMSELTSKTKGFIEWIKIFLKLLFLLLALLTTLMVCISLVWSFTLPEAYVPIIIKNTSLVIGLPLLGVILVLVEAFGRAFAYSGKKSHVELIKIILKGY